MKVGDFVEVIKDFGPLKTGTKFIVEFICPISDQVYPSLNSGSIPDSHLRLLASDADMKKIREQTEMFWMLQLQFLSMDADSEAFYNMIWGIYYSPAYKPNSLTRKIKKLMFNRRWKVDNWTQEEFECICTHFALQLSGIEI